MQASTSIPFYWFIDIVAKKEPSSGSNSFMVSPVRLELTTPCLKGRCSNRLSYGPNTGIIRFCLPKIKRSPTAPLIYNSLSTSLYFLLVFLRFAVSIVAFIITISTIRPNTTPPIIIKVFFWKESTMREVL